MSLTQFAMVEELAFLVKDNLPCKHLVLSMEEMLVDFLQDNMSLDRVLELEPMNPYNRLLLHRLADIFGFSHQSIGEGDDRHLVLKRCEDTSIPSILVSDMLWEHDERQSPTTSQLLSRREESSAGLKIKSFSPQISYEDREAAYMAARKRIFSIDEYDKEGFVKERPRHNPIVARRMIAHALGQNIKQSNQADETKKQKNIATHIIKKNVQMEKSNVRKNDPKEEHIGAAKRMFAHALRNHSAKDTQRKL